MAQDSRYSEWELSKEISLAMKVTLADNSANNQLLKLSLSTPGKAEAATAKLVEQMSLSNQSYGYWAQFTLQSCLFSWAQTMSRIHPGGRYDCAFTSVLDMWLGHGQLGTVHSLGHVTGGWPNSCSIFSACSLGWQVTILWAFICFHNATIYI